MEGFVAYQLIQYIALLVLRTGLMLLDESTKSKAVLLRNRFHSGLDQSKKLKKLPPKARAGDQNYSDLWILSGLVLLRLL